MEIAIIVIFVLGYLAIALEHNIHVDKAAPALVTGVSCWTIFIMSEYNKSFVEHQLLEHLGEISQILFFLLSAMTIVELIDAHNGFSIITKRIKTRKKSTLLWVICVVTFFLSAALDNLATTIVMVSVLRKLIRDRESRLFYVGMVVIAANAGGAWSPIGDVTTTMLWIGGQVTTVNIISILIMPSLVCLLVPLAIAAFTIKGELDLGDDEDTNKDDSASYVSTFERRLVFGLGVAGLIFVPIFKTITHLPPFMGITFSLGILWIVTEQLHKNKDKAVKQPLSVIGVLKHVDTPSVLFFLGILIAVASLQTTGILNDAARALDDSFAFLGENKIYSIGFLLGIFSAIVDNVPLVAASMGMYSLTEYGPDHPLWEFIAYCAGTGGSALIIGSAAGVAAMGMENINFVWYLKRISWLALIGYVAGAAAFVLQHYILVTYIFK